ncbi:MAG: GGDEF domain-containing protein [Bacillota bacterium]
MLNTNIIILILCIIILFYLFSLAFHKPNFFFLTGFAFIIIALSINLLGVIEKVSLAFGFALSGLFFTIGISFLLLFIRNKKIEIINRFNYLQNISYHDRLTGLYNRRFLLEKINRLKVESYPAALVFVDIDNLKQINDNYGHLIGDQAIVKTAEILNNLTRKEDIVARIGGDEFIVFLSNTNANEAEYFCSRIENLCCKVNNQSEFIFSCSNGFTIINNKSNSLDKAIDRADSEMYRSKDKKKGMG